MTAPRAGGGGHTSELTPPGRGAVSVVRVHGEPGRAAVRRLIGDAAFARLAGGTPRLVRLAVAGEDEGEDGAGRSDALDHALAIDRGREGIELHLHGNPALVASVRAALDGARNATCPEERGFEARAAELLATAPSDAAARVLLDQAEGAMRRALDRSALASPDVWRSRVTALADRFAVVRRLLSPPRVVLAGPVNAGKSTLFNALLGTRRVVESGEEGTTRDAIVERAMLGAYAVDLVDTAGERELPAGAGAVEAVERAGQTLARELRSGADLVVWLAPPGSPGEANAPGAPGSWATPTVALAARGDLADDGAPRLRPREDPLGARAAVEAAFLDALCLPREPWRPGGAAPLDPDDAGRLRAMAGLGGTDARWLASRELLTAGALGAGPSGG